MVLPRANRPFGKNGSFECGDKPFEIARASMQTGRLFLTVIWHPREGSDRPPDETIYTNTELKRHCPVLLCEFYERIMKVQKVESDQNKKGSPAQYQSASELSSYGGDK